MGTDKPTEGGERSEEAGTGPAEGAFWHIDNSRVRKMWQTPIEVYLERTLAAAREKNRLVREARETREAAGEGVEGEDED